MNNVIDNVKIYININKNNDTQNNDNLLWQRAILQNIGK